MEIISAERMSDPLDCGRSEEEAISALKYARLNGVARNHLTDQSPLKLIDELRETIDNGLTEDLNLPQLILSTGNDTRQRLSISQGGARLLSWAMHPESDEAVNRLVSSTTGRLESKRCWLELPLLNSDHESDMIEFAKRRVFELQLKDIRLPLEVLDIEKNEGLEFSHAIYDPGTKLLEGRKGEKLTVSRKILQYIRNSITCTWDEIDEEQFWVSQGLNKRASKALPEPITPPLSPIYCPMSSYNPIILDSAFQVPVSSDPLSLTSLDLKILEKGVFEQDITTSIRRNIGNQDADSCTLNGENVLTSTSGPSTSSYSTVEDQHTRHNTLKVEEPLTPPMPGPGPKSIYFSDFVEEMLLGCSSSPPPTPFCGFEMEPAIKDAAKKATQQLEQEGLLTADAMSRIEVPVIDFAYPDPPWKRLKDSMPSVSFEFTQKATIKEIIGENIPIWPGTKHDHANLKWNPFLSDLSRATLDEAPFADHTSQQLLKAAEDDHIPNMSTLTWKPPGLKIVREEDDEEIEDASLPSTKAQDTQVLAKRRRVDFEVTNTALATPVKLLKPFLLKSNSTKPPFERGTTESNKFGLLMGDGFSAENALDSFLELRGMKKPKLTSSLHFSKFNNERQTTDQAALHMTRNDTVKNRRGANGPEEPVDCLPWPKFRPLEAPITLIVSSTLLKNRALVKHIEANLPGIILIERDFTAHNKIAWIPNSVTRSPISSSLHFEADIIVSPTTGIILTTLQKVKQKTLPGQKSKPPIRDRLERASCRYEKIVVLVSASSVDESTSDLNENDCTAFGEFVGFTSGLDSTILVHFVGGDKTLSKWLANSIVQHAGTNINLLEEETHWELFLRRAGMNAYAAQYISGTLRTQIRANPQNQDPMDRYGMANFILMGKKQRIDRFGDICGRRLLGRVSNCLDERWDQC